MCRRACTVRYGYSHTRLHARALRYSSPAGHAKLHFHTLAHAPASTNSCANSDARSGYFTDLIAAASAHQYTDSRS